MLKFWCGFLGVLGLLAGFFIYQSWNRSDQLAGILIMGFFAVGIGVAFFADDKFARTAQWIVIAAVLLPIAYLLWEWRRMFIPPSP